MYGDVFLMMNKLINDTINCIGWHWKNTEIQRERERESRYNKHDVS